MLKLLTLLLCLSSALLSLTSKRALRTVRDAQAASLELPPLYLPEAHSIKTITLGFNNFFADILWFKTLSYFGAQRQQRKDLPWFGHMCDLVTELDGRAIHAYEFCGTLLAWIANDPVTSNQILARGSENLPLHWRLHYLRGFNYWYFLEDKARASEELSRAASIPGAPTFLASLASRLLVSREDPALAVSFLKDLLKNTANADARSALLDKLRRAELSLALHHLRKGVESYRSRFGSLPHTVEDLLSAQILAEIPSEPFGGRYEIDRDTGEVRTTSNEKGLEFSGRTAETIRAKKRSDESN